MLMHPKWHFKGYGNVSQENGMVRENMHCFICNHEGNANGSCILGQHIKYYKDRNLENMNTLSPYS